MRLGSARGVGLKSDTPLNRSNRKDNLRSEESQHIAAQTFTFRELAAATKNFRADCLLGEGGFGRVYKGRLEGSGQVSLLILSMILFVSVILYL